MILKRKIVDFKYGGIKITKNKRFTLAYKKDDWWAVRDGEITLWKEEVVDLLNNLYKENEELKKENKELQITKNFWKEQCGYRVNEHKNHYSINHCRCTADDFIHELKKICKGLQKENEKLKQENHDIKYILEELYYTYIYEPSENYDEEALGQITNLLFKEEDVEK